MAQFLSLAQAGAEKQRLVDALLSSDRTFIIQCPNCNRSRTFSLRQLPPSHPNPFECECDCGIDFSVRLVGIRTADRKPVKLAAGFVRASDARPTRKRCAVTDLSATGMRFTTDSLNDVSVGECLSILVVLDDHQRTKLELPAKVRCVGPARSQVTVGVEFLQVKPPASDILHSYTAA